MAMALSLTAQLGVGIAGTISQKTMVVDFVQLSKVMSHALRHQPWVYELELDEQGWVDLNTLLAALRIERDEWRGLDQNDLAA
jgi:RNA:NAD 2'-phosphotransferase (TPT1/KptA family)